MTLSTIQTSANPGNRFTNPPASRVSRARRSLSAGSLLFLLAFLALCLAPGLPAQSGSFGGFDFLSSDDDRPNLRVSLVADVAEAAPGDTVTLAIVLDHAPGWHAYFRHSGGFSLPSEVEWPQVPEGVEISEVRWQTPERYDSQGFPHYVYHGVAALLADFQVPTDASPGDVLSFQARISGQVCKEACVLYDESPLFELKVADEALRDEEHAPLIEKTRAGLAAEREGWTAAVFETASGLALRFEPVAEGGPEIEEAYFFSYHPDVDGQPGQRLTRDGDAWQLTLTLINGAEPGAGQTDGPRLQGILWSPQGWVAGDADSHSWEVDLEIGAPPAGVAGSTAVLDWRMIGFALLGGLILNLMPCVFPVLGLKVMHFVNQAGEDHRKVVLHGLVFTVGVLVSFWILATLIIALKAATGGSYAWGFQLQEPAFVLAMVLVLFVFSLSLTGLFEFGVSATSVGGNLQRKSGFTGSFFSGVLATVVATPCAAPFLAPALGVALALPPVSSLVLFTFIALGLSLPYLVLSAFPKLIDMLPRPGAWMETFKKLMAFPLYATVAWLLWVLSQQVSADRFFAVMLGLVFIALGLYIYGHWGLPWKPAATKWSARAAAVLLIAGSTMWAWPRNTPTVEWQVWSPERVAELREEGTPVFIDFTAAWCATCIANKARYNTDTRVIEKMRRKGVVALQADFTNQDQVIARALAEYQRGAVPVNILYRPGASDPEFFPELFGASEILERLSTLPDP